MLDVAAQVDTILPFALEGTVVRIVGLTVAAAGFPAPLGAICRIHREQGNAVDAAVVGFQGEETLLLAYGDLAGVRRGNRVTLLQSVPAARVGDRLLGRVLDGRGRFIDNLPRAGSAASRPAARQADASARPAANRLPPDHRRARHRRAVDLRQGSAAGNFRRQRRRKEHAFGPNGQSQLGRRQRDRARRRARPRGARVSRTGSRPRGTRPFGRRRGARATSRPSSVSTPPFSARRLPNTSETRGATCC